MFPTRPAWARCPGPGRGKGAGTKERPWRRASLLYLAKKRFKVSQAKLEAVAALVNEAAQAAKPKTVHEVAKAKAVTKPTEGCVAQDSGPHGRLDVAKYLEHYEVKYTEVHGQDRKGRRRWALKECPFHADHGGRDSVILQEPEGKIGYKCWHDRCLGKGWKDVRQKIGPPLPEHYDRRSVQRTLANSQVVNEEGSKGKPLHVGAPAGHVVEELLELTQGWPKRVGNLLFVPGPGGQPHFFDGKRDVDALFAWIQSKGIRTTWRKGTGLVSRNEFFEHLRLACEEFSSVETLPHYPPISGVYYMTPEYPHGDGSHLEELVNRFKPATPCDRSLIKCSS